MGVNVNWIVTFLIYEYFKIRKQFFNMIMCFTSRSVFESWQKTTTEIINMFKQDKSCYTKGFVHVLFAVSLFCFAVFLWHRFTWPKPSALEQNTTQPTLLMKTLQLMVNTMYTASGLHLDHDLNINTAFGYCKSNQQARTSVSFLTLLYNSWSLYCRTFLIKLLKLTQHE